MSNHNPVFTDSSHVPNTLALACHALHAVTFTDEADLPAISKLSQQFPTTHIVGGGSNLILPDTLDGLTILVRNRGINLVGQCDRYRYIDVAAGEIWHDWVATAMDHGWYGLENLALIPGTVGAAPIQNIGAYGVELASRMHAVRVWDLRQSKFLTLTQAQCQFGYRDSLFKHDAGRHLLIVSVRFALDLEWSPVLEYPDLKHLASSQSNGAQESTVTPTDVFSTVIDVRRQKLPDPVVTPNVGSFFKNPVVSSNDYQTLCQSHPDLVAYPQKRGDFKLAAGWLIDRCGWKGRTIGPVQVHSRQALVLTNAGQATAADVLRVADMIKRDVKRQFGVSLEIEPTCWATLA